MPLTLYQHHLPAEVRVFRYLSPPVGSDEAVVVCDGWYSSGSPIYCRSYMFLTRWLHVFVPFDSELSPREDWFEGFPFQFNCDVTTPHYRLGDGLYTTDLCVDVLVSANGRECLVKDLEELVARRGDGQFGDHWREAAVREAGWLQEMVAEGSFLPFLATAAPFPSDAIPREMAEVTRQDLAGAGFVFHPCYPRYA